MLLPNKSIVNSLLSAAAGSLLAAHSANAGPITVDESTVSGGDFSNSLSGANVLEDARTISGNVDFDTDPDFFMIPSLSPGTPFSLAITYNNSGSATSSLTVRNDSAANIGSSVFNSNSSGPSSGTITGTVPVNGNLIIDIQQESFEQRGSTYTVNLTAVPEPATATVTLLGAAAAALAFRARKKSN